MVEWRTLHCVFAGVSLRQREWDRANSEKYKQIKGASDKMRFDGGVNLFFHFGVFLYLEEAEKPHWGESPPSNSDAFGSICAFSTVLARIESSQALPNF